MENKEPEENMLDEFADQQSFLESVQWYDYPVFIILLIIAIPIVGGN